MMARIGNIGRGDLVHHVGGRVAKHPLGADVEDLNDSLRVGGDAGKVGTVENRALQRANPRARLVISIEHGVSPVAPSLADRWRENRGYRSSSSRGPRLKEPLRTLSGPMHNTWSVALVFSRCGHASVPIGYSAARRCGVEAVMIHGDAHPSSR